MKYLKGTFLDDFKKERIIYHLIEYDQKTDRTIEDMVLIYSKKYIKHVINRIGDKEDLIVKSLISQDYVEVTKEAYNDDIKGKVAKLNSSYNPDED